MKKLNKLFLGLASAGAVAAPIAAVVSCGTSGFTTDKGNDFVKLSKVGQNVSSDGFVTYVTDGGNIYDHSFNEGALNGVKEFTGNNSKTYSVINTNEKANTEAFESAYNSIGGVSKNVVVAGFAHNNPGANGDIKKWATAHGGVNVVAIDVPDGTKDANGAVTDNGDHLFGIEFKTQQSGFMAAAYAGYMLNEQFKNDGSTEKIKVATFGGAEYPTVTSYMIGFREGVKWFNTVAGSLRQLELISAGSSDFSGNFNPGGGRAFAENLLNNGAKAIFAVAGPQTADVDQAIRAKRLGGKAFAIGVDVDQSQLYKGTVLVSAVKGLQAAANNTLEKITKNGTPTDYEYTLKDGGNFVGAIMNSGGYPEAAKAALTHDSVAKAAAEACVYPTTWK